MDEYDGNHKVVLYVYDLAQGMAAMMSQMFLGRHVDGIWHTAVIVFGREYFFGAQGITSCNPGGSILGEPLKREIVGDTFIPFQVFKDYLRGLSESTFKGSAYSLLRHNCNTFSEDLCQFLCGQSIPKYILDLPDELLSTPLGQTIGPLIESLSQTNQTTNGFNFEPQAQLAREVSPGFEQLNTQIDSYRQQSQELSERRNKIKDKIDKKEKKKDKKSKKERKSQATDSATSSPESDYNSAAMSEAETTDLNGATGHTNGDANGDANGETNGATSAPTSPSAAKKQQMLPSEKVLKEEEAERLEEEEKKRNRDPPIVYKEIDPKSELESLVNLVDGKLSEEEQNALEELHQYLLLGEGAWALGDQFLIFVGRVLRDPSLSTEVRVHLLRALSNAALKDDIILLLHQDRREHVLMNFAQDIDRHPPEEQQAIALFMCNLFENTNASEWLLYISEWSYNNSTISNIRATTKVAIHCLLATCPALVDLGTAIVHNLSSKEVKTVVFDDVAIELAMGILQFYSVKHTEEYLFRTMKALSKFVTVSPDIPQLVQMIGPHPKTFKGASERVDALIDIISKKIR